MNSYPKWLIFTILLLNLPTNTMAIYPSYNWNSTTLGVSIGDSFEFKLSEYSIYNGENDTYTQGDIFLNNTSIFGRENATDDEFLNVNDTFSIIIQSNPYFLTDQAFPIAYIEKNDTNYELLIPRINVILIHNTFVANRIMELSISPNRLLSIIGSIFEPLFLIPDWEIYELIYPDYEFSNETIIDQDNFSITKYSRNFDIGVDKITYDLKSFTNISLFDKPWMNSYENTSTHAIINKNTGLIEKLEIQINSSTISSFIDKIKIIIENVDEFNDESPNKFSWDKGNLGLFSLGVLFSFASIYIIIILVLRKKGEKK